MYNLSNFGPLKKTRKAKKSKSMDDLSSNRIVVLSDSQKSILASALIRSKGKQSCPSTPQMKTKGRKVIPHNRSDSNLVRLSVDCGNHSSLGQNTANHLGNNLRKSFSFGETMRDSQVTPHEGPPKKKYMKRFEKIFRPVVGDEVLFNCYSCSLYQDSLASGHLYLTLTWFCFYSNFMGRQRQVLIDVNKIQSITRERTAKIIPNAIKITTESDSYLFSAFISRDRAYKTLLSIWRKSEEPQISCEESDLSDVDSMTRIASFAGFAATPTDEVRPRSTFEDSTSDMSIPGVETEASSSPTVTTAALVTLDSPSHHVENPGNTSSHEEAIPTHSEGESISASTTASNLGCKHWRLWHKAEKVLLCMQSLMQWSRLQTSELFADGSLFHTALVVGTITVVVMTCWLAMRMFVFEEQMEYMISKRASVHDLDYHHRLESALQLNHKLLSQMSDMLSSIHKIVENSVSCCQHK